MSNLPSHVVRAICYIRKSREDEEAELRGEDTLAKQRDLIVRDVVSRYAVAYDLAEEVASGDSIRDRPVFRTLLPQLGDRYQAIVCKDLSRLGRGSYGDMGVVYDIIRDRRIYIITKDTVYDPRNFSDLRMIRFSLFFNREEYEMTLWRLTEGKYDGAAKGKWVAGSVPFGMRYDSKSQVLIASEDEAPVVRLLFDLYVNRGLGFRAIATQLTRLGYRTPRGGETWHSAVIQRMLNNPAYNGTLAFRRTQRSKFDGRVVQRPQDEHIVVPNAFDKIIDDDTWKQAQQRLGCGRLKPKVKLDFALSELAGLVRCHQCKRKMIRQASVRSYTKKDGTVSRYEKEFLYCPTCGYAVQYRDCEQKLLLVLKKLRMLDEDKVQTELKHLESTERKSGLADPYEMTWQLNQRLKSLQTRLERARAYLVDGTLTKREYQEVKEKCEKEMVETERGLTRAREAIRSEPNGDTQMNVIAITRNLASIYDVYQRMTEKTRKRQLLNAVFHDIQLKVTSKAKGKNRPTAFDLYVVIRNTSLL